MEKDAFLDAFFKEYDAIESNELRLKISGEALVRLSEQLNKQKENADEATAIANRILILTELHIGLLEQEDEIVDAMATMLGELCFILAMGVNPEKLPLVYCGSLMHATKLVSNAVALMPMNPESIEALSHMHSIFGVMAQLTIATFDNFNEFADLSMFKSEIKVLKKIDSHLSSDIKLFEGQKVRPQMAIDILYDAIARLKATGLLPESLFMDE